MLLFHLCGLPLVHILSMFVNNLHYLYFFYFWQNHVGQSMILNIAGALLLLFACGVAFQFLEK